MKVSIFKYYLLFLGLFIFYQVGFGQKSIRYDKNGRLIETASSDDKQLFNYDKLGNRLRFIKSNSSETQTVDITAVNSSQSLSTFAAGDSFKLKFDLTNSSELSQNNLFSEFYWNRKNQIDEKAVPLSTDFLRAIEANFTAQIEIQISLPDTLSDGQGYLILKVDSKNLIEETNEENNVISIPITIDNTLSPPKTITADFKANLQYVCPNSTIFFQDQSVGSPTEWHWQFEGGYPTSSNEQNPKVSYEEPGIYQVSLTVSDNGTIDTHEIEGYIVVEGSNSNQATQVAIETDGGLSICENGSVLLKAPEGFTSYTWSNGETSPQISISTPGDYSLIVQKCNGQVLESEPVTITKEDFTVAVDEIIEETCNQKGSISLTVTGIHNYQIEWSNGEQGVSVNELESGFYEAKVISESGCEKTISISLQHSQHPKFELVTVNTSCGEENGSINAILDNQEAYSFEWNHGANSSSLDALSPGNYSVKVTNLETGCSSIQNTVIGASENTIPEFDAGADQIIDSDQETLPIPMLSDQGEWSLSANSTSAKLAFDSNRGEWIFYPKESGVGVYTLVYTATNEASCTRQDSFKLTVNPVADIENEVWLNTGVKIFPNPSDTQLIVQKQGNGLETLKSLELVNELGVSMKKETYTNSEFHELEWNVSSLQTGLYILIIESNRAIYKVKILIKH